MSELDHRIARMLSGVADIYSRAIKVPVRILSQRPVSRVRIHPVVDVCYSDA